MALPPRAGQLHGADAVHVGIRAPMAMGERLRVGSQRSVARKQSNFQIVESGAVDMTCLNEMAQVRSHESR